MLGFLLSQVHPRLETFKGTSVSLLCDCLGGVSSPHISAFQSLPKADCDTTIYYLGVLISKGNSSPNCGERYTIRLWLIFGGFVVGVDLPAIWLITLLNRLQVVIVILGVGCGRALLKAGSGLKFLAAKWAGHIKGS